MRRLLTLSALAATCAAVALPATAGAIDLPSGKDTWLVSARGIQKTTWSIAHTPDGTFECDGAQTGSGTETIRFTSKPVKATSFVGGSLKGLIGQVTLDAKGTVARQGTLTTGAPANPENCPDGVGGGDPAPDCGSKRFTHLFLTPSWDPKGRRVQLEQDDVVPLTPSFEHCPVTGVAWPSILDAGVRFPFRELSESGKHIVIGRAKKAGHDADSDWTTTIRWELALKRVKSERF